jgi:hypothetical protein
MANKVRTITAISLAIAAISSPARAGDPARAFSLSVRDYADVPAVTLAGAEREAASIFRAAGISVAWVPLASAKPWSPHLQVIILSREMSDQKIAHDAVAPGTMGQASHRTGRAYVFYDRAVEKAHRYAPNAAKMLGWVITHEVGHLLLGENSHSDAGIMRGILDRRRWEPRFTPEQCRSLQLSLDPVVPGSFDR